MKNPSFKTGALSIALVLLLLNCKKKESAPEENVAAATPTTPKTDFRDQFTGKYAVTFTTMGTPNIVNSGTVSVRYASASEVPDYLNYMPVNVFLALDNIPFDYKIAFPIDSSGNSRSTGIIAHLGSGKFSSQWTEGAGQQSKTVLGQGTKLP